MTTSNAITLDHINAYFSLGEEPETLNIAPTATGGTGINNIDQYPPKRPSIPNWRRAGTDYVKKYQEQEKQLECYRRQLLNESTLSINTLDEVEGVSSLPVDGANVRELNNESMQNIYSTYFNSERTYDNELTISGYREEILQQLNINPVVIIQGPTGCGKTTQVPQYILDYHQSRGTHCNIIVTQPRKIAAISIAKRVCEERKWQLGTVVGYQVAMDPKTSSDTRLCYVTTGVLLEKLVNAKRMDMYTHVIIDEVHERNQDIDFALLLVKKLLKTNSQRVKVVLMSATIASTEFAQYFSSSCGDPAPIIEIFGKTKDVTEHYLHELRTLLTRMPEFDKLNPFIDPCLYDCVLNLMLVFDRIEKAEQRTPHDSDFAPSRGAVLIFLPGYEEIIALKNRLEAAHYSKNFWIIPLHSSITIEEQANVFKDAPRENRKVIISTNIAESSITVPDVKYVIDFCLTKSLVTDPVTNYTCLQLEWASKANCIQRKGRAGRVDIGKVYRMVPVHFYNELPEYSIPEIKRCPVTKTLLHIKKINICEPQEMLAYALDPPDLSDIGNAVLQLKEALALTAMGNNPFDGELTFIGRVMANLPLDIKLSKLIIFGYVFHCIEECIIIAASLSLQSFFSRPFQRALDAYRSRLAWADNTFSDCLAYLNAYKTWKQLSIQGQFKKPGGLKEKGWAELHFIQIRRIKEVDKLVKEIKNRLEKVNIFVDRRQRYEGGEETNKLILKMIIAGAFFPYYYVQEQLDEKTINKELNENDPLSTIYITGLPSKHGILYASALKELFAACSEKLSIEFEGSRAYIKFLKSYERDSCLIHPAVYMAIKMRKLRMPLELAVFSPEEAESKTQQLLSRNTASNNKLTSNRVTVSEMSLLKRVQLPLLDSLLIRIFITDVINCGHFWARYTTPETSNLVRFLEQTINKERGKDLKCLTRPPNVNGLYLAPYLQSNLESLYYRAQVQEVKGNKAMIFFIDYGNVETINISDLREISAATPDVLETPALAFECQLSEVKPSSYKTSDGQWPREATAWFKKQISGNQMHAKVYSVVQGIVRLELLMTARDGRILSINKELINLDYAELAEEGFASKQNHELRLKSQEYSTSTIISESFSNDLNLSWTETDDRDIRKTGRKVRLHGPFNPLEVSYSGLTNLDRCKCVKVERDSVNSVTLNAEPQDLYSSMLIAANVGVGQSTRELIARNTTLLPKMRGLPSLICLLFAPHVEIRTNKTRTVYTGALCGLGYDTLTGESIYPDHDIEIAFDTEITLEDIREINAIRMGFNLLLHSETDHLQFSRNPISLVHEGTRKTITNLLRQKRNPKEPEFFNCSGQWNQVSPELLLEASVDSHADSADVLPLHKPVSLVTFELDDVTQHLDELYKMVDQKTDKEFKIIRCKLCSVDVTSTRDLVLHLDSEKHRIKEDVHRLKNKT